jgi:hypothetical protein
MMGNEMGDGLLAVIALGVLAGGAIVVIDTFILRRIRRQAAPPRDEER